MTETTTASKPRAFLPSASIIGGAVAIAGGAFFGTACSVLSVRPSMARGMPPAQAYASLATNRFDALSGLSMVLSFLAAAYGGYIAAKHGGARTTLQALAAGLLPIAFTLVMYSSPGSRLGSTWEIIYSLVSPVVASAIGAAFLHRRM